MKHEDAQVPPADAGPVERHVGRLVPQRASDCGLTECAGKPMCDRCENWRARDDGLPDSREERYLRRLLAARVAMPHTYYDDGEASGQEHGISIDFMREPVADIDAKLRALNLARAECLKPPNAELTGAPLGAPGARRPVARPVE